MLSGFLILLLNFVAGHASGILTGVLGTKISQWIATHLKTKTEKAIYTDVVLPLVQSIAALLQDAASPAALATAAGTTGSALANAKLAAPAVLSHAAASIATPAGTIAAAAKPVQKPTYND